MNIRNRVFLLRVAGAVGVLGLLAAPLWLAGYRFNETESLPPGIWRITGSPATAERGQIVSFCPPDVPELQEARDRGYLREGPCSGDLEPLFKPVVAVAGDVVSVSSRGIEVNGELVRNSRALDEDGAGRPMPRIEPRTYHVAAGEVWVVSSYTPYSFDSRYFGPIAEASIAGEARPVWTDGALP